MRLLASDTRVHIDGVVIGAAIEDYPQVVIASAPALPVLLVGVAGFFGGLGWYAGLRNRFRS